MSQLVFPLQAVRLAMRREVEATLVGASAVAGSGAGAGAGAGGAATGRAGGGRGAGGVVTTRSRRPAGSARHDEDFTGPPGDLGLFGPASVTWQVHGDLPSMLVGGVAALLLQTLHPLAMAGVVDHSAYRTDPLGRLRRTAGFVAVTTFGATPAVDRAIDQVRAVHRRVRGVAPDGRPYDASDPDLITWVHTAEVWCFLRAYRRFGPAPLGRVAADRYVGEMAVLPRRLGATQVPETVADVVQYFRDVRAELTAGAQALSGAAFIVNSGGQALPPAPAMTAAARAVLVQAAIGVVPGWASRMLGLRRPLLAERLARRAAAEALTGTLRWVVGPSPVAAAARERCQCRPDLSLVPADGAA